MSKVPSHIAKYAFFYFLALVTLILVTVNVGTILFQIINILIEDTALYGYYDYRNNAFKFGISALLIATPIFHFSMYKINKALYAGDLAPHAHVRKWLSYFILFIACVVLIGQGIGVLFAFFDGELTSRFVLKALVVFALAGSVLSYFLYDVNRSAIKGKKSRVIQWYFVISLLVIIGVFVSAFFFMDSPATVRARNLDQQIVNDLQSIESAIHGYYRKEGVLPENLQTLLEESRRSGFYLLEEHLRDEQTDVMYDYEIISIMDQSATYSLCAHFRLSTRNDSTRRIVAPYPYEYTWEHDAGYVCFERTTYIEKKM